MSEIINFLTGEKILPALISAITTVIVFFLTLLSKNYIDTRILSSKLETEHKFDQRKKIKEVLAKHKVHLLAACENLNHRMWNFANNHQKKWMEIDKDYYIEHHYFHTFAYRILCIYAWINKIQKDMIFLDTTIATKEDLEFIKFLKVFPQIFCDLALIEGKNADGNYAVDHFFRNNFEQLPMCIISDVEVKSYAAFIEDLPNTKKDLKSLFQFLDGISPDENRKRWDRLHFLNITLIIFLNNYGYDFQQTDEKKIESALTFPKKSVRLENYFAFLKDYRLEKNNQVKIVEKIAKKYYSKGVKSTNA